METNRNIVAIFDIDGTLGDDVPAYENYPNCESSVISTPTTHVKFIVRPHSKKFIRKLISVGCDVAIWSSGHHDYVHKIVSTLFGEFDWKFIWDSSKCTSSIKDMREICADTTVKHVLFDDNYETCDYNTLLGFNCVKVEPFNARMSENDKFFEIMCDTFNELVYVKPSIT